MGDITHLFIKFINTIKYINKFHNKHVLIGICVIWIFGICVHPYDKIHENSMKSKNKNYVRYIHSGNQMMFLHFLRVTIIETLPFICKM